MAPPPQGAYRNWRTSGGKLRYSLTGGGWGAAWSGLRRTHDATHLRSAYGRGAPEEYELTQTRRYHRTNFACDWALLPPLSTCAVALCPALCLSCAQRYGLVLSS